MLCLHVGKTSIPISALKKNGMVFSLSFDPRLAPFAQISVGVGNTGAFELDVRRDDKSVDDSQLIRPAFATRFARPLISKVWLSCGASVCSH